MHTRNKLTYVVSIKYFDSYFIYEFITCTRMNIKICKNTNYPIVQYVGTSE